MVTLVGAGLARAEHTAEDARRTTAKLEALRREAYAPPKKPKREAAPKPTETKQTEAKAEPKRDPHAAHQDDADPLWSLMVHAMTIPFDAKEREAHFRDIPKTPAEMDAHLRRLDAALAAKHHSR